MDRFIDLVLTILKQQIFSLKSNMDRFIDCLPAETYTNRHTLKSNMDRFIAHHKLYTLYT